MKIVIDENIALAKEAFKDFGSLHLFNGRAITNELLKDKDVLIVRSITRVDKALLENTNIKFVGSTTIGCDHVDTEYLFRKDIAFSDAAGCNADSVAEYVFTALFKIAVDEKISLAGKTIGVVGTGNIGSKVVRLAEALGMKVLKNDPPKERDGIGKNYVRLEKIFDADIITLHVPLNLGGADKTFHLLNEHNLTRLKDGAIVINTARGAVIDNSALLAVTSRKGLKLILDVWENEPDINTELLGISKIGTAHIAGYSYEGKVNGTKIIYDSLCRYSGKTPAWQPGLKAVHNSTLLLPAAEEIEKKLYSLFARIYNIENDYKSMRAIQVQKGNEKSVYFDKLRKTYPLRREFSNYTVKLLQDELKFKPILEAFRFKVKA